MRNKKYKTSTALSKYVWKLKDSGKNFRVQWSVHKRAKEYENTTKKCNLCLAEKLAIIQADKRSSLNKRTELVSKCRHENKYYLRNFPPTITWCIPYSYILFSTFPPLFFSLLFFKLWVFSSSPLLLTVLSDGTWHLSTLCLLAAICIIFPCFSGLFHSANFVSFLPPSSHAFKTEVFLVFWFYYFKYLKIALKRETRSNT